MPRPHAGQPDAVADATVLRRRRANARSGATSLGAWAARRRGLALRPGPHGLLVALHHPRAFPLTRAAAMCLGDVVLVRRVEGVEDVADLLARRPTLLDHEARHAGQWAAWRGPLGFLPAYAAASLWSLLRHGDVHSGNGFEVAAGLADGGYQWRPPRRLLSRRGRRSQSPGRP
ncbi:hypothetical protein [Aquipuribacter sp. SD81]|uniref:hypothetical protein n=1 Tax=Aquipuribacter sp. SD81 TaxID=3127703 RepID=UPI003016094C